MQIARERQLVSACGLSQAVAEGPVLFFRFDQIDEDILWSDFVSPHLFRIKRA
jgi:hypothetical protein